jgi:hypothetical protein
MQYAVTHSGLCHIPLFFTFIPWTIHFFSFDAMLYSKWTLNVRKELMLQL